MIQHRNLVLPYHPLDGFSRFSIFPCVSLTMPIFIPYVQSKSKKTHPSSVPPTDYGRLALQNQRSAVSNQRSAKDKRCTGRFSTCHFTAASSALPRIPQDTARSCRQPRRLYNRTFHRAFVGCRRAEPLEADHFAERAHHFLKRKRKTGGEAENRNAGVTTASRYSGGCSKKSAAEGARRHAPLNPFPLREWRTLRSGSRLRNRLRRG